MFRIFKCLLILSSVMLFSCKKNEVILTDDSNLVSSSSTDSSFTQYQIFKGNHFCNKSKVEIFQGKQLSFKVRFDSTAIYQSADQHNQADINKLYGFSEEIDNHLNSARIGWNWMNNALHLYAYAYSSAARSFKEIKAVKIGQVSNCSISVADSNYVFKVDEDQIVLARTCSAKSVNGFKQFPYFGGDELAPHDITILIREL